MMKYIVSVIVSFITYSSFASDNLCRSIESGGEGHWPIKESAFNLKNANEALSNLKHYMNNPESEVALEAENDWIIIKGYLLKEPALKGHKMDVKDFCNFIEQEAYVRH